MEIKDCCCKDVHRDTCYAIRYPNYNPDPLSTDRPETCECPCHDQYDDDECDCYDCIECDCYDCIDGEVVDNDDRDTMQDDYKLMSELARGEEDFNVYISKESNNQ